MVNSIEPNFTGTIELTRFMIALGYLKSELNIEDVWLLAEVSDLGVIEEDESEEGEKTKIKSIKF